MTDQTIDSPQAELADSGPTPTAEQVVSQDAHPQEPEQQIEQETAPQEEKPKKPTGVHKRINDLTHKYRGAERERDAAKQEAQMLRMQLERFQQQQSVQQPQNDQWTHQTTTQEPIDPDAAMRQIAQQAVQQIQAEQTAKEVEAQALEFLDAVGDEDTRDFLMSDSSGLTGEMGDVILNLPRERGIAIANHLAANPDQALQIAALPAHMQALQLATLEAAVNQSAPQAPPVQQVSQAPKPAPTIKAKGSPAPNPDKMTTDQWMKWRNEQIRKGG